MQNHHKKLSSQLAENRFRYDQTESRLEGSTTQVTRGLFSRKGSQRSVRNKVQSLLLYHS